mgnify:CR=1 FL=1
MNTYTINNENLSTLNLKSTLVTTSKFVTTQLWELRNVPSKERENKREMFYLVTLTRGGEQWMRGSDVRKAIKADLGKGLTVSAVEMGEEAPELVIADPELAEAVETATENAGVTDTVIYPLSENEIQDLLAEEAYIEAERAIEAQIEHAAYIASETEAVAESNMVQYQESVLDSKVTEIRAANTALGYTKNRITQIEILWNASHKGAHFVDWKLTSGLMQSWVNWMFECGVIERKQGTSFIRVAPFGKVYFAKFAKRELE